MRVLLTGGSDKKGMRVLAHSGGPLCGIAASGTPHIVVRRKDQQTRGRLRGIG